MSSSKQAAWLFCMLILLACFGWYFMREPPHLQIDDKNLSRSPDIITTYIALRRFNETGKLIHFLESPEIQHIPENNIHLIQSPHIILAPEDHQPSWEINAQYARSIHGDEQIILQKDVRVHQNQTEHNPSSLMKTEELIYFPKTKLAMTDREISFEQPGSIVHAQGMRAYFADKRIQLLSKARATYEPKHA